MTIWRADLNSKGESQVASSGGGHASSTEALGGRRGTVAPVPDYSGAPTAANEGVSFTPTAADALTLGKPGGEAPENAINRDGYSFPHAGEQ